MAIKKTQLYSILWESCNILRGSMDASQYKNYVLTMLFLKYISDKVKSDSDIFFDLPEGCSFDDVVALKGKTNIGEEIQKKLHAIARANPRLDHIINEADFDDSTKLGSGKAKVDTLTSLISVFQRDFLDFSKNRAGDDDLIGDAYEYLMKNFAAESGKKKGQFYTPAEVSRLMARLIGIHKDNRPQIPIYDPTCGSGSLLLRAAAEYTKQEIQDRIEEVLQLVGMSNKGYKLPNELSGGEQQRIVIARAVLNSPAIILADEPTGNLDVETGKAIVELLHNICESGSSVVMTTHNLQLLKDYPGRVYRCADHQIVDVTDEYMPRQRTIEIDLNIDN